MEEATLKRVIRAMNSVLNLYDTDFPEDGVDILMEGIVKVADELGLTKIALLDDNGFIEKYVMPEDFDTWFKTKGKEDKSNAKQET